MLATSGTNILVAAITALLGSSALGVFVKWMLDRLNKENTEQHRTSLSTLQEVRDAVTSLKESSDEKFHDISTTLRMGGALAETLTDRVQDVSDRLDHTIEHWDDSHNRVIERLDAIEKGATDGNNDAAH